MRRLSVLERRKLLSESYAAQAAQAGSRSRPPLDRSFLRPTKRRSKSFSSQVTTDERLAANTKGHRLPPRGHTPGLTARMREAIGNNATLDARAAERILRGAQGAEKVLAGSQITVCPHSAPAHLQQVAATVLTIFRAPATLEDYGSYITRFTKWARQCGCSDDPDDRDAVGSWFLELYANGKHSIIVQALKALRFRWKLSSPNVPEHVITGIVLGASERNLKNPVSKALAISAEAVKTVLSIWGRPSAPWWQQMVALALLIQFAAALRFHALKQLLFELMWEQDEGVMAFVEGGKTKNHGFFIPIGRSGSRWCPASLLLRCREHWPEGPLLRKLEFKRVARASQPRPQFADPPSPMPYAQYNRLISRALAECGALPEEEARRVTPHAPRRGSISAMAEKNFAGVESSTRERSLLSSSQIPGILRRAHAQHSEPFMKEYQTADGYVEQMWKLRMRIPGLLGL